MKKIVAILLIISLIGISGCTDKDSKDNNTGDNISIDTVADNNTEDINSGQVDVTSESEYSPKNGNST